MSTADLYCDFQARGPFGRERIAVRRPGVKTCLTALALFLGTAGLIAANRDGSSAVRTNASATPAGALDLNGQSINPLAGKSKVVVLLFINPECPISNRYAPEIQRLARQFASSGAGFWLVYPDPDLSAETIHKHLKEYNYTLPALRDPVHQLVKRARVSVTPEAAVFSAEGELIYHGRIDNRFVDFGKERFRATEHDLEEAIQASLNQRPVARSATKAIGCYIPE